MRRVWIRLGFEAKVDVARRRVRADLYDGVQVPVYDGSKFRVLEPCEAQRRPRCPRSAFQRPSPLNAVFPFAKLTLQHFKYFLIFCALHGNRHKPLQHLSEATWTAAGMFSILMRSAILRRLCGNRRRTGASTSDTPSAMNSLP